MGMTILICTCGKRVKAPGARPGRVGRCPACGSMLEVSPELAESCSGSIAAAGKPLGSRSPGGAEGEDDSPPAGGYSVEPARRSRSRRTGGKAKPPLTSLVPPRAPAGLRSLAAEPGGVSRAAMADGFLPPLSQPETRVLVSILYPLRSAEALTMVVIPAIVFWIFTILVPEYCRTLWADANMMGAASMGMLIILISALPVAFLLPLLVVYMLQYLGRVLVSSTTGDTVPPRTPDRNFEGFFHGLGPWFVWLVLGVGVGFLPLALYAFFRDGTISTDPLLTLLMFIGGLFYAQVALLLTFLHDRPLAANPLRVIGAIVRNGGSILPVLLKTSVIVGLGAAAFVLILPLRASYYWSYLLMASGCWGLAIWAALVTMRVLGLYGFHYKNV